MKTLMIFAAGFGTRMKHLTEDMPKPLVKVNGKPILYYNLDAAIRHGFKHIIINSHYKADQIKAAVDHFIATHPDCPKITLLYEDPILETGGAVKNALALIDADYITTINSDVIITGCYSHCEPAGHGNLLTSPSLRARFDARGNPVIKNSISSGSLRYARDDEKIFFARLEAAWNPEIMDFLLLLHQTDQAIGYTGKGDFEMSATGELTLRPPALEYYRYMNAGAQIFKTSLIAQSHKQIFSLSEYYRGDYRLYGIENDGLWCHLSCPEDLEKIEKALINYKDIA